MDHFDDSEVSEQVKEAVKKTLKSLSKPLKLNRLKWIPNCLVEERVKQEPSLPKHLAVKRVYTDILVIVKAQEPYYADMLEGQYWERHSVIKMAADVSKKAPSTYHGDRNEAISLFTLLLWHEEQRCQQIASGIVAAPEAEQATTDVIADSASETSEKVIVQEAEQVIPVPHSQPNWRMLVIIAIIVLMLGAGLFIFWPGGKDNPIPEVSATTGLPPPSSLPPPIATAPPTTEVVIISVISTPTPSLTPSPTIRDTGSPTLDPSPSQTSTPTNTPTSSSIIGVTITSLYVRQGSNVNYPIVVGLRQGEKVVILGRNTDASWLNVMTSDDKTGWSSARYIKTTIDIKTLPIILEQTLATVLVEPTPDALTEIPVNGQSFTGRIGPNRDRWYELLINESNTVIVLMFEPNVNFDYGSFVGYKVEFSLYDARKSPVWPPENVDVIDHIGVGLNEERDGKLSTGELTWGGPLLPSARYYLHLVNRSSEAINYCLATKDVYEWSCH